MTNEEIIDLAALIHAVDADPNNDNLVQDLETRLSRTSSVEAMLVTVANKLIEGKAFGISSDNPDTLERCRSLAASMGAVVINEKPWLSMPDKQDLQSLVLKPAPRQ